MSQNLYKDTKYSVADNNNVLKKLAKKTELKRTSVSFGFKSQTFISSESKRETSFISLLPSSSNVVIFSKTPLKESRCSYFYM